ncbi:hypothetical protein OKJ99_27205 [Streptomyces endophyticus]|uniref:Mce-associated membrane protein n=2 Tax=Streptomyces endophyticus TaxID=714166 RepID=A0ABU6FAX9_9ACTN|nr:hypothetical protein [Streptomyces endophyticus]
MTAAARAAAKRAERVRGAPTPTARPTDPEPAKEVPAETPAEASVAPEDDGADATPTGRGRPTLRALALPALLLVLVAALVATAVLGLRYRDGVRAEEARREALAAARKAAPVVLSYDYRHLDRDFAAARDRLTGDFGDFGDEYRRTTSKAVGPAAKKYHGVVKAAVAQVSGDAPAASVKSASADRAVVILFVNQTTRSTRISGPRVDLNRVRMTMSRTSDGWKVSGVDAL